METAHTGGAVLGTGDDGHQRIVSTVLIVEEIVLIAGGPVHQETFRVIAHGADGHTGQCVRSAAQGCG